MVYICSLLLWSTQADRRSAAQHGSAGISVDYTIASFAEIERRVHRPGDRFSADAALAIKGSLEPCVMLHLYPRSQLHVSLLVIHDDGGALPCATNAAVLALADAGVSMSSLPSACAAM